MTSVQTRTEHDTFGPVEVPANRLWGAQTQRSLAEDLDMIQALSDFKARQTGYEAALGTYAMVQRMSLFQYLK